MEERFDVAIVGGGSGGYVAAIRGGQLGMKVALIEKEKVGGTCLHVGCIPTKSFLETAGLLARIRRGQDYGVKVENAGLDYPQLLKRTDRIINQLTRGVEFLLEKNKVTLIRGEGRLTSPAALVVRTADGHERRLSAENVIIATGSAPKALPDLPFDGERVINSDQALRLKTVPRSVAIIGAGAVGVEFASIFNDFGAEVTLVEMLPALVPLEDGEISTELARAFNRRGIRSFTGARAGKVEVGKDGVTLEVSHDGQQETLRAEVLLVAVGRAGNVSGMGLEGLSVALERGFIEVDHQQRTAEPGVYAIGDVAGGYLLAHKAMAQGVVAIESIAGQEVEPVEPQRVPRATYCRPAIASVGLSEKEARDQGLAIKVGRFPFRANARALIDGEAEGFAKVVGDERSGEILGVHIIGPHATELIAEPTLAKLLESTPWEVGTSIHPHPSLSEVIGEACGCLGTSLITSSIRQNSSVINSWVVTSHLLQGSLRASFESDKCPLGALLGRQL